jgi:hypothetical protein
LLTSVLKAIPEQRVVYKKLYTVLVKSIRSSWISANIKAVDLKTCMYITTGAKLLAQMSGLIMSFLKQLKN